MKRVLFISAVIALFQGCVYTTVSNDTFTAKRIAIMYPFKTGGFEYNPKTGLIKLLDYNTDGGGENLKAVAVAAYEAGLKSAR